MSFAWPSLEQDMVRRETSPPEQTAMETEKELDHTKPNFDLPQLQMQQVARQQELQGPGNPKNPSVPGIFDPALMCEHDKLVNMLNPEPLPYQVQRFKSSTALKVIDVPRRHNDSFGRSVCNESLQRTKAIILHTERFAWDAKPQENLSQRDRLTSEQNHVEVAKVMKRRGDVLSHRERHELLLGGEKVSIQDRDMSSRDVNEALRGHLIGPGLTSVPEGPHELRTPEVSMAPKDQASPDPQGKENAAGLWEPERQTFENQFNTVSMGVQRALLHPRDKNEQPAVSAPAPPPPRRPSQVPRLPRLPMNAGMTSTGDIDPTLASVRPPPPVKRRGITEMIMGGARASLNERADIQSELRRLKSVPLPQTARELYHGRGIKLPPNHATLKPRLPPPSADPIPVSSFAAQESPPPAGIQGLKTKSGAPVHISPADKDSPSLKADAEAQEQEAVPAQEPTEPLTAADQEVLQAESQPDTLQPERRPGSTPLVSRTPNPLKGALFKSIHPDVDEEELLNTFQRMDTDMDGHVTFNQMESEIPADMTPCEKRFVKEIYDIVASSTFFGSVEFTLIKLFCRKVKDLRKDLRDAFEETRDTDLRDCIVKFVEMYQSVDRSNKGEISYESLKYILSTLLEKDINTDAEFLQSVMDKLALDQEGMIGKLDFLTYVPFFLSLEPSLQKQFVATRAKTLLE